MAFGRRVQEMHGLFQKRFIKVALALVITSVLQPAQASDERGWQLFSTAKAKWMWFDVYDASLYLNKGAKLERHRLLQDGYPIKLQLCYLRPLTAQQIIEAAEQALPKNMSGLQRRTVDQLHQRYRDVDKGDCYSLHHDEMGNTTLLFNRQPIFHSRISGFKKGYFGIWLGDTPLSEDVKERLLNANRE